MYYSKSLKYLILRTIKYRQITHLYKIQSAVEIKSSMRYMNKNLVFVFTFEQFLFRFVSSYH